MDIRILNKMVCKINALLKEEWDFMAAKNLVLNKYDFSGEKERKEYSSILSKHFGKKGGQASAKKKRLEKEERKELQLLLEEAELERMICDARELEHQEELRKRRRIRFLFREHRITCS